MASLRSQCSDLLAYVETLSCHEPTAVGLASRDTEQRTPDRNGHTAGLRPLKPLAATLDRLRGQPLSGRKRLRPQPGQTVLRRGYRWKPDIYRLTLEGQRLIVKDYADKEWVFRWCVGAFSIWREGCIYRKLQGLAGIAGPVRRIDRYAMAVPDISGWNAEDAPQEMLSIDFFQKLRKVVDAVHQRGVVLCDLRNIKNMMVGTNGEPYLIDLSTAFCKPTRNMGVRAFLFRLFLQDDLLGIAKLKRCRAPHLLTSVEQAAIEKGLWREKEVIFLKKKGRALLRKLFGWGKWPK